jgi:hypothetical protein
MACGYQLRAPRAIARATHSRAHAWSVTGRDQPRASAASKKKADGFWHTRVRKERHTLAYMCRAGTVSKLSQMLEIGHERQSLKDRGGNPKKVSSNRYSVVV